MRVFLIDDEKMYSKLLHPVLQKAGHILGYASSGTEGLEKVAAFDPDVIILDIRLPDMTGFDILERLRSDPHFSHVPVIFVSSLDELENKLKGFGLGAEDYLTKPFNEREFEARVRVILRRQNPEFSAPEENLVLGDLKLSLHSHKVLYKEKPVELTAREFDILRVLLSHPEKALTREDIVKFAWGPNTYLVPRVVDVHLGHLRGKLGPAGRKIETIPQIGYRIMP